MATSEQILLNLHCSVSSKSLVVWIHRINSKFLGERLHCDSNRSLQDPLGPWGAQRFFLVQNTSQGTGTPLPADYIKLSRRINSNQGVSKFPTEKVVLPSALKCDKDASHSWRMENPKRISENRQLMLENNPSDSRDHNC